MQVWERIGGMEVNSMRDCVADVPCEQGRGLFRASVEDQGVARER